MRVVYVGFDGQSCVVKGSPRLVAPETLDIYTCIYIEENVKKVSWGDKTGGQCQDTINQKCCADLRDRVVVWPTDRLLLRR